jgi:hypothetical protein
MSNLVLPRKNIQQLSQFNNPEDFKRHVLKVTVEALKGVDVMFNQLLLAIYIRPEKIGSIIRPNSNVEEDVWQGKAGLVLKVGPNAFEDDGEYNFHGQSVSVGEWVAFKVGDAWALEVGGFACRLVRDSNIKLKVQDPSVIL